MVLNHAEQQIYFNIKIKKNDDFQFDKNILRQIIFDATKLNIQHKLLKN